MKHNPDDRRDNVDKIQFNINHTIRNMELAEEMIAKTDNEQTRRELKEKNKRRRQALNGMRAEIRDEALAKKNNYQE
ncbi:MAG: small acid-soluble spore protein Tlp [Peptococcaceae bacterium]|jgi:small acid-soluble spore protein (thioredoxin-like protein)|nr:small acid-soluble spore protein Tlp [Peptococcaceae bacterium]